MLSCGGNSAFIPASASPSPHISNPVNITFVMPVHTLNVDKTASIDDILTSCIPIPANIHSAILPPNNLCISDLSHFYIPPATCNNSSLLQSQPGDMFSKSPSLLNVKMPLFLLVTQFQHMISYRLSFKLRSLYQLLMLVMYQSAIQLNQLLQQTSNYQCGYLHTGNKYTRFFVSRLNGNW
jgi:hypothetical protein